MHLQTYSLIKVLYFISILLISALPTGTLLNIPIKILATLILIVSFLYTLYQYKISISKNLILTIFFISSILLVYTTWGSINFGYIAVIESRLILTTVILTFVAYIYHIELFSKQFFFQVYSYATFSIFLIKIIAYLYAYMNGGREAGVAFYHLLFNIDIISMDLPFGMFRLYLQTDIIAAFYPLVLSWAVREKIVSNSFTTNLILITSIFVVFSSFSRYLIAVSFIGLFLYAYIRKDLLKLSISILPFLFIILYLFYDVIIEFIELRFFSNANDASDHIRLEQTTALVNLFFESPYFGFGIGAYDSNYIRSITNPFSYEKQILSFLPKIGFIGIVIMLLGFLYAIYQFLREYNIIGLLSISLFVLSGLFNPYLYSSNVVLIYVFILIMLSYQKQSKSNSIIL